MLAARNEGSWDAFVKANGGCFLQSWGWSRFQEAAGRTAFRYQIAEPSATGSPDDGETSVQFLVMRHALPLGAAYAYVPRGPVIARGGKASGSDRFASFVGALHEAARREGCVFARVELPYPQAGGPVSIPELESLGFRYAKPLQPADTSIVDLGPGEEELLAAMHPKTRYNIRLAMKHGVEVREAAHENAHVFRQEIDGFWRLLAETSERDKFHTHPRAYYETMLDVLSPKKGGGLQVRLVLALYKGEPAAAALVAEYGDTMTYLHGASAASLRQYMAPYLLHWKLIAEAKARGFAKYDFWGVAPTDDPEHPWAGITRFKRGFGGRRESYLGAWELPISGLWYNLYRFAKRFRNV